MSRRSSKSGKAMTSKKSSKQCAAEEGELSDDGTVGAEDDRESGDESILSKIANECGNVPPDKSVSNTDAASDAEEIPSGQRLVETQGSQTGDAPGTSGAGDTQRGLSESLKQFSETLDMSAVKKQIAGNRAGRSVSADVANERAGRSTSADPKMPPNVRLPSFEEYMEAMRNPQRPPLHLQQSWFGSPANQPAQSSGYMGAWQPPWGPYGPLPWGIPRPPMPPAIEAQLQQIYPLSMTDTSRGGVVSSFDSFRSGASSRSAREISEERGFFAPTDSAGARVRTPAEKKQTANSGGLFDGNVLPGSPTDSLLQNFENTTDDQLQQLMGLATRHTEFSDGGSERGSTHKSEASHRSAGSGESDRSHKSVKSAKSYSDKAGKSDKGDKRDRPHRRDDSRGDGRHAGSRDDKRKRDDDAPQGRGRASSRARSRSRAHSCSRDSLAQYYESISEDDSEPELKRQRLENRRRMARAQRKSRKTDVSSAEDSDVSYLTSSDMATRIPRGKPPPKTRIPKVTHSCQTDPTDPGNQMPPPAQPHAGSVTSTAVDAAPSGATKVATTVIVTTPLTTATQNVTATVAGTTTTPALVSDAQKVTAIIESLHATHQSAEKTGDDLPPILADMVNNMAWRIYTEAEVNALYRATPPPKNAHKLQTINLNDRVESKMMGFGKSIQATLAKIHKPMQRAMVPVANIVGGAMEGVVPPIDELITELTRALNLGGVSLQRVTKARRDVSRDSLPERYKDLADRKHDVEDGLLFGNLVNEEYERIAKDSRDDFFIAQMAKVEADKADLGQKGRAGAPNKYPAKNQQYKKSGKQEDKRQDKPQSESKWKSGDKGNSNNSNSQRSRGGGDRKWRDNKDRYRDRD